MHKTGATSDNVDTAEESTIALREDTSRTVLELLKILLDHTVKKEEQSSEREREKKKHLKDFFFNPKWSTIRITEQ